MMASNRAEVFDADDDCAAGYFAWLELTVAASGDDGYGTLTSMTYGAGTTVPDTDAPDPDTGAPPETTYVPLFYVTTKSKQIDSLVPLVKTSLGISMAVIGISCGSFTRQITLSSIG